MYLNMSSGKWRPFYLGLDMYVFDCVSNQVPEKCVILQTFNDMFLNAVHWIFKSSVQLPQNTDPPFLRGSTWSIENHSPVNNIALAVTTWTHSMECASPPASQNFVTAGTKLVDNSLSSWSLNQGSIWSGLIKAGSGTQWTLDISQLFT